MLATVCTVAVSTGVAPQMSEGEARWWLAGLFAGLIIMVIVLADRAFAEAERDESDNDDDEALDENDELLEDDDDARLA